MHGCPQPLGAFAADAGDVPPQPIAAIAELLLPIAALPGLQAVFVAQLHQAADVHQLFQERRQAAAQGNAVLRQVLHQQISQHAQVGAQAGIHAGVSGQLADEEHQGARAGLELAIRGSVVLPQDGLVDFAQQFAGIEQVGGQLAEQEIRRHHCAEGMVGVGADGLIDDAQLGAQLPGGAGSVHGPQSLLPKAATHRQQGVVLRQHGLVLAAGRDAGTVQMAVDLPGGRLESGIQIAKAVLAFRQHHPADDRFHIVVREFHIDGEAALQALQRRRSRKRGLPGADEQHPVAEALAAGLNQLLHHEGAVRILADVLLHFVQDDGRAGDAAAVRQGVLQRLGEFFGADVVPPWKLRTQRDPGVPFAAGKGGVGVQQRFRNQRADIKIAEFAAKVPTLGRHRLGDLIVDAVLLEPKAETRLRIACRQVLGSEQDAQEGQTHTAARAGAKGAGGGVQALAAPAEGGKLRQRIPHIVGQPRQAAGAGAVFREAEVRPQEAQHLRQVGLAAAEEAANPSGGLFRLILMMEVGTENALQARMVLAFADEMLQLEAQGAALLLRPRIGHGRNPAVRQGDLVWVPAVNVAVLHT